MGLRGRLRGGNSPCRNCSTSAKNGNEKDIRQVVSYNPMKKTDVAGDFAQLGTALGLGAAVLAQITPFNSFPQRDGRGLAEQVSIIVQPRAVLRDDAVVRGGAHVRTKVELRRRGVRALLVEEVRKRASGGIVSKCVEAGFLTGAGVGIGAVLLAGGESRVDLQAAVGGRSLLARIRAQGTDSLEAAVNALRKAEQLQKI